MWNEHKMRVLFWTSVAISGALVGVVGYVVSHFVIKHW